MGQIFDWLTNQFDEVSQNTILIVVMGNPGLVRGPDLEMAVHNVAEPVTQPKTGLNTGRT